MIKRLQRVVMIIKLLVDQVRSTAKNAKKILKPAIGFDLNDYDFSGFQGFYELPFTFYLSLSLSNHRF